MSLKQVTFGFLPAFMRDGSPSLLKNNNLLLSIMDLGSKFDPVSYYKLHGDEDLTRNIGLRTVIKTAKEVKYYNSFNSNNIMISL